MATEGGHDDELSLAPEVCWISLRAADRGHCAVSITGELTGDAARLVRRWVVLLRDATYGDVAIHCEQLTGLDEAGLAALQELVWGLRAQHRIVSLESVPAALEPRLRTALGHG